MFMKPNVVLTIMTSNPAPAVYGGDEVSALVFDTGSNWTRVGIAGEDTPRAVIPTYYGAKIDSEELPDADGRQSRGKYYYGDSDVNYPRPGMEIANPMKDGIVQDWDAVSNLWSYCLGNVLQTHVKESPILMTEQIWNTDANREKAMELAFEQFESPACYIVKSPVCSLFASGKGSGVVVDVGAQVTSVTPILDGLVLFKNSRRTRFAGNFVNKKVAELFTRLNIDVTPYYMVASKEPVPVGNAAKFTRKTFSSPPTTSFHEYQISRVLDDFKESQVQIAESPMAVTTTAAEDDENNNNSSTDTYPVRNYELPNGANYELGIERFQVGEYLFNPDPSRPREPVAEKGTPDEANAKKTKPETDAEKKEREEEITASLLYTDRTTSDFSHHGLSDLIVESITKCDVDIQANLANHIVVTGGSSLIQGLTDRTFNDLTQALSGLKIRIHAPGNTVERKYSSWIGGSILASLGTFHQLWISKQEYQEVGPAKLLEKRFR